MDVRGSAPGTRETDLLKAENMVDKVHAIVLSGGSAFGLESASGVMAYLEEEGHGLDVGLTKVPIVPGAVIFDLAIGDPKARPDKDMGYKAAELASMEEGRQGNVGAGMGATVGKILGPQSAMKAGLGSASLELGELQIGALVVVNAFGDIFDYQRGQQIAGPYDLEKKEMLESYHIMKNFKMDPSLTHRNTTIGVIATNAILSKAEGNKLAQMGHNGLARSINPVHTMLDGDSLFTMATNKVKVDINLLGTLAAELVSQAIVNALYQSKSLAGLKSYQDL